ncbi:hypothetical protein TanjilG_01778 [Lupinus angustifolius]|uniref:Steroid 5-alpha reductase C-terminal domain-containing protein n=1 Tax=Lupinus angustifolius TaxID=3871 RepID=A0A1J7GZU8_LUPAN|nr:PREDICTED: uncharacterized protein LOC109355023 [Lupinus angustifolius]OIW06151.1 hypothetical protein TanjilG_01778 [Lupinus angustifolius]
MEAAKVLSHSKTVPFGFSIVGNNVSLRPLNKHFHADARTNNYQFHPRSKRICFQLSCSYGNSFSTLLKPWKKADFLPPRCSISSEASTKSPNLIINHFRNLSLDSIKATLLQVTPIDIVKWSGILAIITTATKWTMNMLVSPFFWMYFSWTWLFWPWTVAIVLAVYGLYCFRKHLLGEANIFEQLTVVTSVFTWLTLVPPGHFNGYLEGWPLVFFFVYHYFFFLNVSVRKRLYGDYYARPHDPKWDVNSPVWSRLLFSAGVMVGHWLAAFEGPELHRIPGGWNNLGIWALIILSVLMQYNATLYLAKYSENVVVPSAVVQFGPYRWVRHPIYSSTMLLFATYCIALRAPLSLLFLVVVCCLYYKQKAEMEEALMVESFGESYTEYANKVKSKLIPFIY